MRACDVTMIQRMAVLRAGVVPADRAFRPPPTAHRGCLLPVIVTPRVRMPLQHLSTALVVVVAHGARPNGGRRQHNSMRESLGTRVVNAGPGPVQAMKFLGIQE